MLFLPNDIKSLFQELKSKTYPARFPLSEEEQALTPAFEKEVSTAEIVEEIPQPPRPIDVVEREEEIEEEIKLEGFIDGVQRTVLLSFYPLPNGATVPIHLSHIAVGVLFRSEDGKLFLDPELVSSRLLLLGPFELLRRNGANFDNLSPQLLWDNDERAIGFPKANGEWVICDTSYRTTLGERDENAGSVLTEEDLFNIGLLRCRARWRAATLRHRLEFAVLARCKHKYPGKWLLVDGPLFFPGAWGHPDNRTSAVLGKELGVNAEQVEDKLLHQVVGLIKRHRFRPPRPVLEQVLGIQKEHQRSAVICIREEVDRKEQNDDPEVGGKYGGAHLTWYTRLRFLPQTQSHGLYGLVRVDLHRASLGLKHIDNLSSQFQNIRPLIDTITCCILRESLPGLGRPGMQDLSNTVYPIYQLERILKSSLYPRRYLACLMGGW